MHKDFDGLIQLAIEIRGVGSEVQPPDPIQVKET